MQPAAGGKPAALRAFRYDRDDIHRVEIHVDGDKVAQKVIERPVEVRTAVVSGEVGRSLFHSARKLGLSGTNLRSTTDDIFKYDINFNTDVAASDRLYVVDEPTLRRGGLITRGPILAAPSTPPRHKHTS